MSRNNRQIRRLIVAGLAAMSAQIAAAQPALEMAGHRALHRQIAETDAELTEFQTDGCSGGLSASWRVVADTFPDFAEAHGGIPPWENCCVIHDKAYHAGGRESAPAAGFAARSSADDALRSCVIASGEDDMDLMIDRYDATPQDVRRAYRAIAQAMYGAVRVGGGPCSGLPWRWGFGSPQCIVRPSDFSDAQD